MIDGRKFRRRSRSVRLAAHLTLAARGPLHVSLSISFFQFFAFVMQFTTFTEGEFAFGDTALIEKHSQRNQRQPFFFGSADEFAEFTPVNQQLPRSHGFMVPDCSLGIFSDIATHQPQAIAFDPAVGFIQLAFAVAKTFDFAADQHDATFQRIDDFVLVPRLAVLAHDARNRLAFAGSRGFTGSRFRFGVQSVARKGLVERLECMPSMARFRKPS